MSDPVAFLNARLDGEEPPEICGCLDANHWPPCTPQPRAERTRREIKVKRLLLAGHEGVHRCDWGEHRGGDFGPCQQVRLLMLFYADHPDYDEDWAPAGKGA